MEEFRALLPIFDSFGPDQNAINQQYFHYWNKAAFNYSQITWSIGM